MIQQYTFKIPQNVTLQSIERCICIIQPFAMQKAKGSSESTALGFLCFSATKRMHATALRDCTPPIHAYSGVLLSATGDAIRTAIESRPRGDRRVFRKWRQKRMENRCMRRKKEKEKIEDEVVRARENFSV